MIKMIVSDYDGTLTLLDKKEHHQISERNLKAILKFQQKGGLFVIATGRHPSFLQKVLPSSLRPDAIIGFSGNILEWKEYRRSESYSHEEIKKLLKFTSQYQTEVSLFMCDLSNDFYYTDKQSFAYRRKINSMQKDAGPKDIRLISEKTIKQFITSQQMDSICRVCFSFENTELMSPIKKSFELRNANQYELVQTGPRQYEIMHKGINKASQIAILCQLLHIKKNEVAVIGDSYNDLAMFENYEYSFCIEKTEFSVLEAASYTAVDVAEVVEFAEKGWL